MAKNGIEITNIKEVQMDFHKYSKKVDNKNQISIKKYSLLIMATMKSILFKNVIRWTGNLANSISIVQSDNEATISPDTPYDKWIEDGGRGGFRGYHYVRDAVKQHKNAFINAIQKNLKP